MYPTEKVEVGVIMHKNCLLASYYISSYLILSNIILSYTSNVAGVPDREGGDQCDHAQELPPRILKGYSLSRDLASLDISWDVEPAVKKWRVGDKSIFSQLAQHRAEYPVIVDHDKEKKNDKMNNPILPLCT